MYCIHFSQGNPIDVTDKAVEKQMEVVEANLSCMEVMVASDTVHIINRGPDFSQNINRLGVGNGWQL